MADGNFTLKFDVEPNKASVQQSGKDIQSSLDRAIRRVGGFNSITTGMRNAFSTGFSYAQSAATKTFTTIRQQMYNALSTRWADPTFSNVASQFTSGMKRGVEQLGVMLGDKLRQAFVKADVDAKPLAEEVGTTVEQTLKSKIANALIADGKVLGGFSEGKFTIDDKAYNQRWGDLMLGAGGEEEFADAVSRISAELSMAVEESSQLEQNGEQASEQYQVLAEMAETAVNSLRELYGFQGNQDFGLGDKTQLPDTSGLTSNLSNALEESHNKLRSLGDGWDWLKGKIADTASTISTNVGSAFAKLGNTEFFQMLGRDAQRIGANFRVMADGVSKTLSKVQQLASISLSGLKKGIGSVISRFRQMGTAAGKSADQASKKMKRMTLQMIKAMLGVRGLYMLFRKLRQAIKEGMDTLAQNVPEFNKVFSDFKTALNGIKGSVGTAFQPILQVVLPILTQLANALSNVMVMIAKFNAVLTGQGYIYKFTAAQQDYAKSLKGTGGAAKKATKDLMGFDEINRLSAPNEGGGGGSGGIGDYQKEMIDKASAISEFAEMVKEAWAKADFTDVGRKIGESIKSAMESVTDFFDTQGQKWAKHLSASLSTLINGLVDVDGLGYSIGEAIGSGLNVGITFLHDFWRDTDFEGIGEQLGGAINGLFDKVDWVGLGEYFAFKFNGIFDFIGGLADSTKWQNIGTDLGNGLNAIIENIDLGEATSNVSSLIVGMLESGISFITTTDWEGIGGDLAEGLEGIDWKGVLGNAGTLISKGAQGICNMVISFVKKTDWNKTTQDIIKGVEEMFANVWDDGNLINKLAEGIGALLGAAVIACFNVGNWIYDNIVVPLGEAWLKSFPEPQPGDAWYETGWNIIQGLLKGIWDALMGIAQWISDNIVQPIIDGICDAFGIHSPSTVMMEIGGDLIEGLFEGLKGIWDFICGIFEDLKENILGIFNDISSGISDIWEGIKSTASTIWTGIKTTVVNIVSGIFRVVTAQFTNLKDGVLGIFRTIRDVAGMIWDGLCSVFSTVFEGIWQTLQTVFGKIAEFLDWLWQKILDIKAFFEGESLIEKMRRKNPELFEQVKVASSGGTSASVPHLATGSVLPPNSPFLAMVGDQTHGTNVEAPLDTIKQAVAEVMLENNDILTMGFEAVVQAIQNKDMSVRIGDKDIAQANDRYNQRLNLMRGTV